MTLAEREQAILKHRRDMMVSRSRRIVELSTSARMRLNAAASHVEMIRREIAEVIKGE